MLYGTMWTQIVIVIICGALGASSQTVTLKATIWNGAIKGTITFTQNGAGSPVSITHDLSGPYISAVASFMVSTHRVLYDAAVPCKNLGDTVYPPSNVTWDMSTTSLSGLELTGNNSIEGRSLTLMQQGIANPLACGLIERDEVYVTAVATFRETIFGSVTLRQAQGYLTRVYTDLKWPTSLNNLVDLDWWVVAEENCDHFNPSSRNPSCSSDYQDRCVIGDFSGKLGKLTWVMSSGIGGARFSFLDLNLPVSNLVGKALQLVSNNQVLACAIVRLCETKTVIAQFGDRGSVTMTQRSPLDPTEVKVNLKNLEQLAGGYHVHAWPVPQRAESEQQLCSADSVSGHYNPFNVNTGSQYPAPNSSTLDMYEVGDLSGKKGMLTGQMEYSNTFMDYNLQLFGRYSVVGRSLVIHKAADGSRWLCSNLRDTADVIVAMATFTTPVIGYVMLQQRTGKPFDQTSVFVWLDYCDGTSYMTKDHGLQIYNNTCYEPDSDVFAPYSGTTCNMDTPLLCRMGDLSAKYGTVSIRGGKSFFTDINLPLQGPNSVIGQTVVVKTNNSGMDILACAQIMKVYPLYAEVSGWSSTADYGMMTFTQRMGVVDEPTAIHWQMQSLPTVTTISQLIHNNPLTSNCSNLGGVFNPFNATSGSKPMGDLSQKFGMLTGPSVTKNEVDLGLHLWGPRSVLGRALTLNWGSSGIACSEVKAMSSMGGRLVQAKAIFSGEVAGEIHFTQWVFDDGAMMPTTVVVNLRKANGNQTVRHNWHTHQKPVLGDADTATSRCASTGGHYNPFNVSMSAESYADCSRSNPLRCELGDQASKVGTYDMGSGPKVFTDVYLPLDGEFAVTGRSIVVHIEDKGSARLDCADILPETMTNSTYVTIKKPDSLDKEPILRAFATALNTHAYNMALEWTSHSSQGCSGLRIYFLGKDAVVLKQHFDEMAKNNPENFGNYIPFTCTAACGPVTSLLMTLLAMFMARLLQS